LFHIYLMLYESTVIVPRRGALRFAGGQTNLHNGSLSCITARAVLLNEQLEQMKLADSIVRVFILGCALLSTACDSGKAHILPYIIASSLKPDFGPLQGSPTSAFHQAVKSGNLEYVKARINADPYLIRRTEGFPRTAAMVAAQNGQTAMLNYLISEHGWAVNEPIFGSSPGTTVIEYAIYNGHIDTVRYLLGKGAVLRTGKEQGLVHSRLIGFADERSRDPVRRRGLVEIARLFIERGENVNEQSQDATSKKTALHLAAREHYPEMIALLLSNGADPSIRDRYGATPLDTARNARCIPCIELLNVP
jgi:hypothetical protein